MKISEHRSLLLYLCIVIIVVLVLVLTGIAIIIPFSIPLFVGVITAIFGYFNAKKSQKKEIKIENKEIAVPKPPTSYFAHSYPMQKNFTGREKERKELTEWLKNDSNSMFVCAAIGGMGKSALAWYWLTEDVLKKDDSPEGVIWWSFYDKEASFESFLNHAIKYTSEGKIDPKKIESTRDKMDMLYSYLSENQFVMVLDGAERLLRAYAGMGSPYQSDDITKGEKKDYKACVEPNCGIFLQMLASVPKTKTLITTRICPKELDNLAGVIINELKQMDVDDALQFFKRQGVIGTRAEIEDVCETYGSHPLSLRLLSGMIIHDLKSNGDIKAWTKYNPLPKLIHKEHHVLEFAYDSLDKKKQMLASKLSAFRNPMDYDAVLIFNDFGDEEKFNTILNELVDRGMLFRDEMNNKFDLHPVVRKYCYDRLRGKESVHSRLMNYFAAIPETEKIESRDDLATVIELYHHTVKAGKYFEAVELFKDRLAKELYYRFGAYQTIIELIRALFPDGENRPPRMKDEIVQAWAQSMLANSYSLSGQPRLALPLFEMAIEIEEKIEEKKNLAIGLSNIAHMAQFQIGELDSAESNLRRSIEICREIKDKNWEPVGHMELARLLAYRGKFEESENELIIAFENTKWNIELQGLIWAYCFLRAFLMSNAQEALEHARKIRELADDIKNERYIIFSEYFLGAAHLMKRNLSEAEKHLNEALIRDRKINMVDYEPDILLELAKLRFIQNRKPDALKFAQEALQMADRCEYRLKEADIQNFMSELYLDVGDLMKAREHGEIAKEKAGCGYVPAMEKAEKLLKSINSKN